MQRSRGWLFRFEIEKMTQMWLKLFSLSHSNALWFGLVILGLIATGLIAGYFVKKYPHVGGIGIPEVKKLQLEGNLTLNW